MEIAIDAFGWLGTLLVVSAYALLSSQRLHSTSVVYQAMNVVGSVGVGSNAIYHGAYPSVGINVVWILIGVLALLRIYAGHRGSRADQ